MSVATIVNEAGQFGGPMLQTKVAGIASTYGEDVATTFVRTVSASSKMRNAYAARQSALNSDPNSESTNAIVRVVSAAEQNVLAKIVEQKQTGSAAPAPATVSRAGYRDVAGAGGWGYRQFSDGAVTILRTPTGHETAKNITVRSGPTWEAITKEIGAYSTKATASRLPQAPNAGSNIINALPRTLTSAGLLASAVGAGAAAAGATGTASAAGVTAVSGLLTAAGVTGASVPVVGWIAAGGLAAAAGIIALVSHHRKKKGKADTKKMSATARKLGLPDADKFPKWAAAAIAASTEKRQASAVKLDAKMKATRDPKKRKALATKLQIIAAADLLDRASKRRRAAKGKKAAYRDVRGAGGYTYRQYRDGSIEIMGSPAGGAAAGTRVTSGAAWEAITREIGAFPKKAQALSGFILRDPYRRLPMPAGTVLRLRYRPPIAPPYRPVWWPRYPSARYGVSWPGSGNPAISSDHLPPVHLYR